MLEEKTTDVHYFHSSHPLHSVFIHLPTPVFFLDLQNNVSYIDVGLSSTHVALSLLFYRSVYSSI